MHQSNMLSSIGTYQALAKREERRRKQRGESMTHAPEIVSNAGLEALPFFKSELDETDYSELQTLEAQNKLDDSNACLEEFPFHRELISLDHTRQGTRVKIEETVLRICGPSFDALSEHDRKCPICREDYFFEDGNVPSHYPIQFKACGHISAQSCIFEWLDRNNSCLACRHTFSKEQLIKFFPGNDLACLPMTEHEWSAAIARISNIEEVKTLLDGEDTAIRRRSMLR